MLRMMLLFLCVVSASPSAAQVPTLPTFDPTTVWTWDRGDGSVMGYRVRYGPTVEAINTAPWYVMRYSVAHNEVRASELTNVTAGPLCVAVQYQDFHNQFGEPSDPICGTYVAVSAVPPKVTGLRSRRIVEIELP